MQFTPHVACLNASGVRAKELREAGVPVVELKLKSLASLDTLRVALFLRAYVRRHKIRLMHAFDAPMSVVAATAGQLAGTKVILTSQRCFEDTIYPPQRKQVRLAHRLARGVVVNAEAVRPHLIADYRLAAKKIRICRNGIDVSRFAGVRAHRPPFTAADVVLGTVCVLRPEKGLSLLVEGFGQIRAENPRARLLIVGSGPELPRLEAQVAALGLAEHVHFEPATADVSGWMRAIDIFVMPSLSEAFSNSIMEAMASRCAVVASNAGGNPELVEDGETGLVFDTNNATDLARQLRRLLGDQEFHSRVVTNAHARLSRDFTLSASSARMQAIYDEFLSR